MTDQKQLIAWLNDARAMEMSLAAVLENHARAAAEFTDVRARLEEHRIETEAHAEKVAECLRLLGTEPSSVKAAMGKGMGMIEGMATGMFRDEMLKNFLMDYAAESMEIAAYTALITAAEELDLPDVAEICREVLEDEIEMAAWLEERIPEMTKLTLQMASMR